MTATLGLWEPSEQLLEKAICVSRVLLDDVGRDVLTVPEAQSQRNSTSNRSTIGCMLSGCRVESCLIGAPAWNSEQMETGDVIMKVDGTAATDGTIQTLLKGCDEPGSPVKLDIKRKKGGQISVVLHRMASAVVADKRRLFELFTTIKDSASKRGDSATSNAVTECIQVWTRMMLQVSEPAHVLMNRPAC